MATSISVIRGWLKEGQTKGATHLIVVCDTLEWEDFPVYVMPGENPKEIASKHGSLDNFDHPSLPNDQMEKVMEVYSLTKPWEEQLYSPRTWNFF